MSVMVDQSDSKRLDNKYELSIQQNQHPTSTTGTSIASDISSNIGCAVAPLSIRVKEILENGLKKGLREGVLYLAHMDIGDDVIPQICSWIFILDDRIKDLRLNGNRITSKGAIDLFETLRKRDTQLFRLDLSNNLIDDGCAKELGKLIQWKKSLQEINIASNRIADLGIQILIEELKCNVNLKKIDFQGNIGITDKSMKHLLKILESSNLENINTSGTSIAMNSDLAICLACKKLQNNSTVINLRSKELKKYDVSNLKEIDLSTNWITSDGASLIFSTLKEFGANVVSIDLSFNQVDDESMRCLGEYIQQNHYMEHVNLGNNQVSDKGIEILSKYLFGNKHVKKLNLIGNSCITSLSSHLITKIIESCHVEDLGIESSKVSSKLNILLVLNGLKNGKTGLFMSYKKVTDDIVTNVCKLMRNENVGKNVKEINFSGNQITSKGASLLFDTLRDCESKIVSLDVSNNHIDNDCMENLGRYVQRSVWLENLNIGNNQITDKGIELLRGYIIGETKIKTIWLNGNKDITNASYPLLIDITKKSHVVDMNLEFTFISDHNQEDIQKLLKIPMEKREIPIDSSSKSASTSLQEDMQNQR